MADKIIITPPMMKKIEYFKTNYPHMSWRQIGRNLAKDFNLSKDVHHWAIINAWKNKERSEKNKQDFQSIANFNEEKILFNDIEMIKKIKIELIKKNDLLEFIDENVTKMRFVVTGCFQIPFHNTTAVQMLYSFCRDYRPHLIILNGDFFDMFTLSRFTRNGITERESAFRHEMTKGVEIMSELKKFCPDATIILRPVASNHEERFWKLQYERVQQLIDYIYFEDCLFKTAYMAKKPLDIKISEMKTDYIGECSVQHAGSLNKYGVMHNIDNRSTSMIVNHSHKANHFTKLMLDSGKVIHSIEAGCMCNNNPEYTINRKFVRGFCYGEYDLEKMIINPHLNILEEYL